MLYLWKYSRASTPRFKKTLEQGTGLTFPDAAHHFGVVVAGRSGENPRAMIHPAAFRVIGTENHAGDAKEGSRLGAHGAGFQRHRQGAIAKPSLAETPRRFAQGEHFSMG